MNLHTTPPNLMSELTSDFFEPSYPRRLLSMLRGLRHPRSSREYRSAVIELQRLSAPVSAVVVPFLAVGLLLLMEHVQMDKDPFATVVVVENDPVPDLKDLADPQKRDAPAEDPATVADLAGPALKIDAPPPGEALPVNQPPTPALIATRSRAGVCTLPGLSGVSRGSQSRGRLMAEFDGDQKTEDSVMRALRWLKKNQQPDGSWKSQKIAMTGLATLTYLAHGEKPGDSAEFGETVRKALEFLMSSQTPDGRFSGMDGNEYAHPIATYALCEAYGMTLNPNIKSAAEKALVPIIKGQHPTGGWNYRMDPGVSKEDGKYRDDTSYMGWCAQALKAAKLSRLQVAGLEKAVRLTVKGFQKNANPKGGFGYTSPGQGGLTSVGTLCMQLLGATDEPEVKKSLDLMDSWRPSLDAKNPLSGSLQYSCYYATQAKFHAGGKRWDTWNKAMKSLYVNAQQVEKNAIKDGHGQDADIGWWVNGDAHTDRPVMDTCLAALQLMVYYRYLPTTSKAAVQTDMALAATPTDAEDITLHTGNL